MLTWFYEIHMCVYIHICIYILNFINTKLKIFFKCRDNYISLRKHSFKIHWSNNSISLLHYLASWLCHSRTVRSFSRSTRKEQVIYYFKFILTTVFENGVLYKWIIDMKHFTRQIRIQDDSSQPMSPDTLGVEWLFYKCRLRSLENIDISTMIHNSGEIVVMK